MPVAHAWVYSLQSMIVPLVVLFIFIVELISKYTWPLGGVTSNASRTNTQEYVLYEHIIIFISLETSTARQRPSACYVMFPQLPVLGHLHPASPHSFNKIVRPPYRGTSFATPCSLFEFKEISIAFRRRKIS